MSSRYFGIKLVFILAMLCNLVGGVLLSRAEGQAIEAKPTEQPADLLAIEVLNPADGANFSTFFSTYLTRLKAVVKRNWYIAMPESALLGQKGKVVVRVQVLKDGTLLSHIPVVVLSSGEEPLDKAALDAIRSSLPFERLPGAFRGPHIDLRFTFTYNDPPPPKQRHGPTPEFHKPSLVDT